jgi:hypothetical protein
MIHCASQADLFARAGVTIIADGTSEADAPASDI